MHCLQAPIDGFLKLRTVFINNSQNYDLHDIRTIHCLKKPKTKASVINNVYFKKNKITSIRSLKDEYWSWYHDNPEQHGW